MYIATRRLALLGGLSLLGGTGFLFACSKGGQPIGGVTAPMLKAYADDLADALSAGADVYINTTTPPVPTPSQIAAVVKAKADIQTSKATLDSILAAIETTVPPTTAIGIVKLIIADAQKLDPFVAPLIGPAGLYVPLAVSILQAFVDGLAIASTTPPVPPAALNEKARAYRRGVK